jgi:tyrosine-specific transport protein
VEKSKQLDPFGKSVWTAALLIAGIAIGAGELGLPLALGGAGYYPAVAGVCLIYICTLVSGMLIARLVVESRHGDLPVLFLKYLGNGWATLFNVSYFTLAFCLLVAYWSGLLSLLGGYALVMCVLGIGVYIGLCYNCELLRKFCSLGTIALIISFLLLVAIGFCNSKHSFQSVSHWRLMAPGLPIILCSFGYHQIIPTICRQLDYQPSAIRRALLLGTFVPLAVTLLVLTLGFRIFSQNELMEAAKLGLPMFALFRNHGANELVFIIGRCFSILAIATSLLGIAMAMNGALADIRFRRMNTNKFRELLVMVPLPIALLCPHLFVTVLGIAGGIFGNIIAGIIPIMPFLTRQRFRPGYLLLWLIFVGILFTELAQMLKLVPPLF